MSVLMMSVTLLALTGPMFRGCMFLTNEDYGPSRDVFMYNTIDTEDGSIVIPQEEVPL